MVYWPDFFWPFALSSASSKREELSPGAGTRRYSSLCKLNSGNIHKSEITLEKMGKALDVVVPNISLRVF